VCNPYTTLCGISDDWCAVVDGAHIKNIYLFIETTNNKQTQTNDNVSKQQNNQRSLVASDRRD
jgi:hypothetical protein